MKPELKQQELHTMHSEILPIPEESLIRYSRQLILNGWSLSFQEKLLKEKVRIQPFIPSAACLLAALGIKELCLNSKENLNENLIEHLRSFNPDTAISYSKESAMSGILFTDKKDTAISEGHNTVLIQHHNTSHYICRLFPSENIKKDLNHNSYQMPAFDMHMAGSAAVMLLIIAWQREFGT